MKPALVHLSDTRMRVRLPFNWNMPAASVTLSVFQPVRSNVPDSPALTNISLMVVTWDVSQRLMSGFRESHVSWNT